MGWGGSVAAMIQSLRDNKALLGNRKTYFDNKVELRKVSDRMKISLEKATPEQLQLIRKKLRKQKLITRLKSFAVLVILSPIIIYVGSGIWSAFEEDMPMSETEIFEGFYNNIKKGDEYFKKKQFKNAYIMYENADEYIKNTDIVSYRKGLVSVYECFLKDENCGYAGWVCKKLSKKENLKISEQNLRSLLFKSYMYNHPNDSSIEVNPYRKDDYIFDSFFNR